MGAVEARALAREEATVKYHPALCDALTERDISHARTVAGGQFDWGGRLRKCNGGARKVGSARTVLALIECNGTSQPDGEIDGSSRHESGP